MRKKYLLTVPGILFLIFLSSCSQPKMVACPDYDDHSSHSLAKTKPYKIQKYKAKRGTTHRNISFLNKTSKKAIPVSIASVESLDQRTGNIKNSAKEGSNNQAINLQSDPRLEQIPASNLNIGLISNKTIAQNNDVSDEIEKFKWSALNTGELNVGLPDLEFSESQGDLLLLESNSKAPVPPVLLADSYSKKPSGKSIKKKRRFFVAGSPAKKPSLRLAVAALIMAIAGALLIILPPLGLLLSLAAIITGMVVERRVEVTPNRKAKVMAKAAIIIGSLVISLTIIFFIGFGILLLTGLLSLGFV